MANRTLVFVWPVGRMLHSRLNGLFGPVYLRCNAEPTGKTEFVHHKPLAQGVFQLLRNGLNSREFPLSFTIIIDVVKPRLVGGIDKWNKFG